MNLHYSHWSRVFVSKTFEHPNGKHVRNSFLQRPNEKSPTVVVVVFDNELLIAARANGLAGIAVFNRLEHRHSLWVGSVENQRATNRLAAFGVDEKLMVELNNKTSQSNI